MQHRERIETDRLLRRRQRLLVPLEGGERAREQVVREGEAGIQFDRLPQRPDAVLQIPRVRSGRCRCDACASARDGSSSSARRAAAVASAAASAGGAIPRVARMMWQSASADHAAAKSGSMLERALRVAKAEVHALGRSGPAPSGGSSRYSRCASGFTS